MEARKACSGSEPGVDWDTGALVGVGVGAKVGEGLGV
jgi:hypothetical protein